MDRRQEEILDFVKSMVHDAHKHDIAFNLIEQEIDDIVAFMHTLTDGYNPRDK